MDQVSDQTKCYTTTSIGPHERKLVVVNCVDCPYGSTTTTPHDKATVFTCKTHPDQEK